MNKRLSTIFKKSILNLYKNGEYSVDYLILKATYLFEKGRLTEQDYNELMEFFISEQEKEEQPVENIDNLEEEHSEVE